MKMTTSELSLTLLNYNITDNCTIGRKMIWLIHARVESLAESPRGRGRGGTLLPDEEFGKIVGATAPSNPPVVPSLLVK